MRPDISVVAYVLATGGLAALGILWLWRPPGDVATLVVGAASVAGLAAFAVDTVSGVHVAWSSAVFVHLGLSLSSGPAGALAAASADAAVDLAALGVGWIRTIFNASAFTLANLSAVAIAQLLSQHTSGATAFVLTGATVGITSWVVDYGLIAGAVHLASHGAVTARGALREGLSALPYHAAYGWAAAGAVVLHRDLGVVGFTMLVVPVVAAQVFLVRLDAASRRHELELRTAEERERRRIARDLHDTVVQVVSGWSLRLAAVAATPAAGGEGTGELGPLLTSAASDLRSSAVDLRTLIMEIAPPTLRDDGLAVTLRRLVNTLTDAETIRVVAEIDDVTADLAKSTLILRVAQESLRNVVAHAHAETVRVTLRRDRARVVLSIVDDGSGFTSVELDRSRSTGHFGTSGLREAAAEVGATLNIASEPAVGTTVRLEVPTDQD